MSVGVHCGVRFCVRGRCAAARFSEERHSGNRRVLTQWTHHYPVLCVRDRFPSHSLSSCSPTTCSRPNDRLCQFRSLDLPCGPFAQPLASQRRLVTRSLQTGVNTHGFRDTPHLVASLQEMRSTSCIIVQKFSSAENETQQCDHPWESA